MPRGSISRSHNEEFQGFLFDYIGEDLNGGMVTVLSALARLGVDPWQEASELNRLPESEAVARLDAMMSNVRDVPSLVDGHGAVAQRLIAQLPRRSSADRSADPRSSQENGSLEGTFGQLPKVPLVVLIVLAALVLSQVLSFGVTTP